jgi:putative toxin-antitoxin system antitoxin component (TIGR02293 family)
MRESHQARASAAQPRSETAALVARINKVVRTQLDKAGKAAVPAGSAEVLQHLGTADIRFSATAAEAVVRRGLKATVLQELAGATGMDMHHLLEFAGIDRSTVSRRVARDDLLPQEASVRAMQLTDLVATAVDVFGSVEAATGWLTKPHPVLEGETPMQRARTPWGMQRVRSILGALKYGGAV